MGRKLLKLFVLELLVNTSWAFDCGPKTFTTLTHLLNEPVKEEFWTKQILPNGEKEAPLLADALKIWDKSMPDNKLIQVYSAFDTITNNKIELTVENNVPYLWIGYPSEDTTATDNAYELHACVSYFYSDRVVLISTIDIKEVNNISAFTFFIETISIKEFIERTMLVYKLDKTPDPSRLKTVWCASWISQRRQKMNKL